MDMIRNNYSPDNHKGGVYNILSNYNELSAFQNGGWDALSSDTQAAINRLKSVNTNWGDILFRDAFSQEYNLSLSAVRKGLRIIPLSAIIKRMEMWTVWVWTVSTW